jgi:HEAT repeat protein
MQTRRSSAAALRQMHTAAAIGPLLTALKDSDHGVKYQAVIGLAELTGQYEWGPSVELFLKDEHHYVAHWQEWGRTQK